MGEIKLVQTCWKEVLNDSPTSPTNMFLFEHYYFEIDEAKATGEAQGILR